MVEPTTSVTCRRLRLPVDHERRERLDVVTKYRTAFPDCRLDITELLSTGDKVVARFRFGGRHNGPLESIKPTGRQVAGSGIGIYTVSGDRIRE